MAYHQLGRIVAANERLHQANERLRNWMAARVDNLGIGAETSHMRVPHRWALLTEANRLIRGVELKDDTTFQSLRQKITNELAAIRPELADHDRALMFQPNEPRLWLARAQRLAALSRWEEAESDFQQATSLKADDPFFWLTIARYRLAHKDIPRAGEACVRAIELDHAGQWTHLTHQLLTGHDELFASVLAARPRDVELWTVRGTQLCAADRWREAAAVWEQIIQLGDDSHLNWYRRALLQAGAGDVAGQGETCRGMLARFGSAQSAEGANFTAWSCVVNPGVLPDYTEVLSMAQRFADSNVALAIAHTTLGAVWLRSGRPDRAVPALNLADELNDPDDPDSTTSSAYAWYLLAIAHSQLGQVDAARQWYDRATSWMDQARDDQAQGTRPPWPWNRRLTLDLLRSEASRSLSGDIVGRATSP
jgi:tetratricopeptide (TPR) repeat protein